MEKLEKFRTMILSHETHAKITIGMAVSIILFIVGGTWGVAIYIGDIKQDVKSNVQSIETISCDVKDNKLDISEVQKDNVDLKVAVSRIDANIEAIRFSIQALADKD